ncbi:MAG: glucosamine-6-phosphate deaminase [Clostridia bacterium]|nr:glucosamine-6-phosphate deaminase [Clostridia bacterium]
MEVKIFNNAQEIAVAAAELFTDIINNKNDAVLGLATGATPVPTYNKLVEAYEQGKVSFKDVRTFNLDEYCDLPKDDKNSYYTFMHENLFNKVDVKEENVNFLDGNVSDWEQESKRYSDAMAAVGGIDIQLLGIGTNGHIGFNEPADAFTDESFKVTLTQSTIDSNQKYFGDVPMPRYALTMGIGSIMRAKKILLIATGASKAEAIKGMIKGEVTPKLPASVLNEHSDVIVMLDKEAASLL